MTQQIFKYNIERQPKLAVTYIANLINFNPQHIHSQLRKNNINLPKFGNKSYITHDTAKILFNLNFNKMKIAFQVVKGGTGKTITTHNISCAASVYGARVLCIDLDPQGNLTDAFGIDPEETPVIIDVIEKTAKIEECIINVEEGIDLIPSRIENIYLDTTLAVSKAPLHNIFNNYLSTIENNYDFIFIDCPPAIGHSVTAASLYADLILVPINPDKFSTKGLSILKKEISNINEQYRKDIKYKTFLNKHSINTKLSHKSIQTIMLAESESGNALDTAIRQTQEIPNIVDSEFNVFSTLKNSLVRDDFNSLTRELLKINIDDLINKFKTR